MKRAFIFLFGLLPAVIVTAEPSASMSFQGYSGLINTPTATLFDEGSVYLQYGNQVETRDGYRNGTNYNFGLGLWEYVEVSGRLAEYKDPNTGKGPTDLSANIKLGIPFIPKDWFSLALGIQDLGGAANLFDAKYAVASKNILNDFNISLGLGESDSRQGRLNGVFAGVAWQPYPWVKISAEYDASDTQLGMHLSTPKQWLDSGIQVTTDILLSSTNEELSNDVYYGLGLKIPLNYNSEKNTSKYKKTNKKSANAEKDLTLIERDNSGEVPSGLTERENIQKLLVEEGFEYISVGQVDSNTVYVEVQDHLYNRNKIDGLGVVLGILSDNIHYNYSHFKLVLKEREIPILIVKGNIAEYEYFLKENEPLKISVTTDTFSTKTGSSMGELDNSNNSWFKPRFTFWPGINSRVGTEFGVFDASLALVSHIELPLWHGAAITALHTLQVAETKNFEDGEFFSDGKQKDGVQDFSFHQTFSLPFSLKNMTSYGRYRDTYDYLANEVRWQSFGGSHKINLVTARYENQITPERLPYEGCNILFLSCWPDPEPKQRDIVVAKYKYYNAHLNATAELQIGKYWQQDKGMVIKLERMFGDVTLTLSYKDTKIEDEESNKLIGLGFSIPLTPRKDYSNKYFQIRGKPKWEYSVNTLVGKDHNQLTPGTGDNAQLFYNLDSAFYNNDRLGKDYIYANSDRLKQAYYEAR